MMYGELIGRTPLSMTALEKCLSQGLLSGYKTCEKRLSVATGLACKQTLCCWLRYSVALNTARL